MAEDEHGNLIRWLLVGRTYVIDEGTVYKWWGWLTDLRLNEGQDNPWDIAEWTELGNDPIELMHRIRARESVGSS